MVIQKSRRAAAAKVLSTNSVVKRLTIAMSALLIVVACVASPPGGAGPGITEGNGVWSYATGPHGEHCLFYETGSGNGTSVAFTCDTVKP